MAHYITFLYEDRATPLFEFENEPANKARVGLSSGIWVDPSRIPTIARQIDTKQICDLFPMPGLNAVSSRFRDLVEQFEPGVHQFFPLRLFLKDGSPVEGEYFVFNCAVLMDTILTKRSNVRWKTTAGEGMPFASARRHEKWVLSRPAIGDHHLWCSARVRASGGFFVSDKFHAALKECKIKYFEDKHCQEVDDPWIKEQNVQPQLDWEAENDAAPRTVLWHIQKMERETG